MKTLIWVTTCAWIFASSAVWATNSEGTNDAALEAGSAGSASADADSPEGPTDADLEAPQWGVDDIQEIRPEEQVAAEGEM